MVHIGEMKEIINALEKQYPKFKDLDKRFSEGASDDELETFAERIDMIPPQAFCKLYKEYNGEKLYLGSILEFSLMNLEKIMEEIKYVQKLPGEVPCADDEMVRTDGYEKGWIPFADDADGSFIMIDMNPDMKGNVGQVIAFDCREWKTFVLAKSLEEFLQMLLQKVDSKEIIMTEDGVMSWIHGYHFEMFS